jgi:hypothetical protein
MKVIRSRRGKRWPILQSRNVFAAISTRLLTEGIWWEVEIAESIPPCAKDVGFAIEIELQAFLPSSLGLNMWPDWNWIGSKAFAQELVPCRKCR